MPPETKQEAAVAPEADGGEGESDVITLPRVDYDKMNETLGSLKRENRQLKKPKEEPKETPQKTETGELEKEIERLREKTEKATLKSAGLTHEDDVKLAKDTAKKWGVELEDLIDDADFKIKLQKQQDARTNADATSNVKGDKGSKVSAKDSVDYWMAKGKPPTAQEVPDFKKRAQILRAFHAQEKGSNGGKFYNS